MSALNSRLLLGTLLFLTIGSISVRAQSGQFSGQVTDPQGAAVPGATIELLNRDTFVKLTAQTDQSGNYVVPYLLAGRYQISVQAPGFSLSTSNDLTLGAGQAFVFNVQLTVGSSSTKVEVQSAGGAAGIETESAEISGTITAKEVTSLGLNGRNFSQLIALTPGVSNQTGQDEGKVGVVGSVKYSVNGGRVEYNSFEVDGDDVLNTGLNGASSTLMVYPSLDAIQEVKVLTSNYGAMYGRTASGIVEVTTKSGGPSFHGNLYEFVRNEMFNARNFFDQTKSAPLYRRNDFGGTIGGPLYIPGVYNTKKDKTFFFFSEEVRLEKTPSEFNQAVPSLKERGLIQTPQGIQQNLVTNPDSGAVHRSFDFSDVCPLIGSSAYGQFQRLQFPDCPSPSSSTGLLPGFTNNDLELGAGVDKNALALLDSNLIPLPNSATGCSYRVINPDPTDPNHCYDATVSPSTYWREELFRIDHNFSSNTTLMVRYIHDAWNTTVLTPQWGVVRNSFPTVENKFVGPGTDIAVQLTHAFSPTLLNEFGASYTNSTITLADQNGPGGAQYQRNPLLDQPLVIDPNMPGKCNALVSADPFTRIPQCAMGYIFNNGFGGKNPGLVFAGTNAAYGGEGFAVDPSYMPWSHTNPTYAAHDQMSKSLGKHTLRFGAQIVYAQRNQTNNAIGAATGDLQGLLTFSNLAGSTGNAFADFLLTSNGNSQPGFIQSFTQDSAQGRYYQRYLIGEPYFQDDWKVTPRLTVNLGVRISLFGTYHEKNHNAWNWVASRFDKTAFSVDPVSGALKDATGAYVPIDSQNQLPPDVIAKLGLVQCGVSGVPDGCMTGHLFNPAPRIGFAWDPLGNGKMSIRAGYGIFFEHGTGNEANTGSLEASAPLVLNMTQHNTGYQCIGNLGSTTIWPASWNQCGLNLVPSGSAYPLNVTSIPTQAVWPYAQQWSFGIQSDLPHNLVGTLAYVGSKGTHLTTELNLNQLAPLPSANNPFGSNEPITVADCTSGSSGPGGYPGGFGNLSFTLQNGATVGYKDPAYMYLQAACASAQLPDVNSLAGRPYPGLGKVLSLQNVANSSYNALQATLRRTQGPLTLGISYTYSHSFDNSSDRSDPVLPNSYNLKSNWASSDFDERHLLNVSYIYELPLVRMIEGLANMQLDDPTNEVRSDHRFTFAPWGKAILDHWQLSGITIYQSGTPFSVINSAGNTGISLTDNAGVASGLGSVASYPDVLRGLPQPANNSQSFGPLLGNPSQFVAPRGLTFGDAGRNFLNNPSRLNFDMSLLKNFMIREKVQVQFRAEAFNVFNHTQFRIYDPDNPGNTGNNIISCYAGPLYSAGFQSSNGADCITGAAFLHPIDAHRPRTLQLGLKLSF